jgi:hypothetical protein
MLYFMPMPLPLPQIDVHQSYPVSACEPIPRCSARLDVVKWGAQLASEFGQIVQSDFSQFNNVA